MEKTTHYSGKLMPEAELRALRPAHPLAHYWLGCKRRHVSAAGSLVPADDRFAFSTKILHSLLRIGSFIRKRKRIMFVMKGQRPRLAGAIGRYERDAKRIMSPAAGVAVILDLGDAESAPVAITLVEMHHARRGKQRALAAVETGRLTAAPLGSLDCRARLAASCRRRYKRHLVSRAAPESWRYSSCRGVRRTKPGNRTNKPACLTQVCSSPAPAGCGVGDGLQSQTVRQPQCATLFRRSGAS